VIDRTNLPGISLALEEQQALMARITASELFRRSPRQRQLLTFIAGEQFASRSRDITEQRIGQSVFGRAEGYNQSEDNIVRVSVRQLRARLKCHFETEGLHESWMIEIPKGGYRLEFHARQEPDASAGIPAIAPVRSRTVGQTVAWMVAAASSVICLLAGFWLGTAHRVSAASDPLSTQPRSGNMLTAADDTAVNDLFDGPELVNLVVADTGLLDLLAGRQVTLEEYVHPALLSSAPRFSAPSQETLVTSLADISFVSRVLQSPGTLRDRVRVLHARNGSPNDFMSGSAVILGGPRVNPWSDFFESKLNFQFRYGEVGPGCIANRQPRPSEQSMYGTCRAGDNDRYARIAWLPNLNHSGQVLIISGSGMLATENACDYLLTPGSAGRLRTLLGIRSVRDVESFELLLKTDSRAGVPSGNRVVTSRVTMARTKGR